MEIAFTVAVVGSIPTVARVFLALSLVIIGLVWTLMTFAVNGP